MVGLSSFPCSSALSLSWKEKHGNYSSLIIRCSSGKFVQLCTECFWTPALKNYAAVLPWVFFSVYLIFSIPFTVTAAGSIETPCFEIWAFQTRSLGKFYWTRGCPTQTWDTDAAGEAHETRCQRVTMPPCWEPWCPWHAEGCYPESCEHTAARAHLGKPTLNCFLCPSFASGPVSAPLLLPKLWAQAMPGRVVTVAGPVPSARRAFALPLQPFVLLGKSLPSETALPSPWRLSPHVVFKKEQPRSRSPKLRLFKPCYAAAVCALTACA